MRTDHEHTPEAIALRLGAGPSANYLRDWIYGGIDGAVTTFAVVSGVVGAGLSSAIIVVLGVANLLADGFSMAAGNYSGTRAERDIQDYLRRIEHRHIEREPEGEREEIRQIFRAKGFTGEDLERVVGVICADEERWVRTMLVDEYGLPSEIRSPWLAAVSTFSAFVVCGAAPLLPYIFGLPKPFWLGTTITSAVFFAIGCVRARWSIYPWWKTGLGTLAIGSAAAWIAYLVGYLLRALVPGV